METTSPETKEPPPAFSSAAVAGSSSPLTFKLCYKDDIRRFTVTPGLTTYASLVASGEEVSGLPGFKMTWKDEDGDLITLRSQFDLDEALGFMKTTQVSSLKVVIEEIAPPTYTEYAEGRDEEDVGEEAEEGEEDVDAKGHLELEADLHDMVSQADLAEGGDEDVVPRKIRKKLEKYDEKLGKKYSKWLSKTEKLRRSPYFNEQEYNRQIEVLEQAKIPVYPYIRLLLAKRLVWTNKRIAKKGPDSSTTLSDVIDGRNEHIPHERKLAKMTDLTRQQLDFLREHNMPTGWPIVSYLEFQNKQQAVKSDELTQRQMGQLKYLRNLPEPLVVCVLRDMNEKRKKWCKK